MMYFYNLAAAQEYAAALEHLGRAQVAAQMIFTPEASYLAQTIEEVLVTLTRWQPAAKRVYGRLDG